MVSALYLTLLSSKDMGYWSLEPILIPPRNPYPHHIKAKTLFWEKVRQLWCWKGSSG